MDKGKSCLREGDKKKRNKKNEKWWIMITFALISAGLFAACSGNENMVISGEKTIVETALPSSNL